LEPIVESDTTIFIGTCHPGKSADILGDEDCIRIKSMDKVA
jgi:hypothetical protein